MANEKKEDKFLEKHLKNYVNKKRSLFAITVQDGKISFSGSRSFLDFIDKQDLKVFSLAQLCENLQNVSVDHNFATKKPSIFPLLPTKYKGGNWTVKVCQRALQTNLSILGTYNSNREAFKKRSDFHHFLGGGQWVHLITFLSRNDFYAIF